MELPYNSIQLGFSLGPKPIFWAQKGPKIPFFRAQFMRNLRKLVKTLYQLVVSTRQDNMMQFTYNSIDLGISLGPKTHILGLKMA